MLTTDLDLSRQDPGDVGAAHGDRGRRRKGQVPDLATVFDERGAEGDNEMARARDS